LASCTPVSGVYFSLDTEMSNSKEIYSALLAAYMADKKILLRIIEGSNDCTIAYVKLDANS